MAANAAKRKLLILIPTRSRGGVEAHGLAIARAAASTFQVEAAFPHLQQTKALIEAFEQVGASYQPLAIGETEIAAAATLSELIKTLPRRLLSWLEKPWHFLLILRYLLRWQSHSPSSTVLINLPWADKGFTSLLACALLNQPTAVVFHLIPWKLQLPKWKRSLYKWAKSRRQTWIAISENNRTFVRQTFRCQKEEIALIYNGTPTATPTHPKATTREQVRLDLGLSPDSILLLTVARLNQQKGHDTLIPAIPHLIRQFPNIHFIWVGDGEQQSSLVRQLESYNTQNAVSLLRHREDIPDLLAAADLFIFPTHFEGFPFALLEAMARRLPIVATSVNGIPEIIEHTVEGLLVREGDSCDLLEALRWALTHSSEMKAMGDRAALKVQNFSAENMTAQTIKRLQEIATVE